MWCVGHVAWCLPFCWFFGRVSMVVLLCCFLICLGVAVGAGLAVRGLRSFQQRDPDAFFL